MIGSIYLEGRNGKKMSTKTNDGKLGGAVFSLSFSASFGVHGQVVMAHYHQ